MVVTAAAPLAARLVPGLTDAEQRPLNGVTYQGIVCASVLLKKPLARYYVTNITDDWVPFTGGHRDVRPGGPAEFGGQALVYLPKYVRGRPGDDLSDDEIERAVPRRPGEDVPALRPPRTCWRSALARAARPAISTLDYSTSVPPLATSVPGVYLVNSAQIVNGTLNVNETVQLAERAATALLAADPPPARVPTSGTDDRS